MICVNKYEHLVMQHPSLGSITEGPTVTSEILVPTPRLGQELSIYICLSPVKTADFMHPKWEGCIVINSVIFVVVCRNIFYSLNLGKNYLWTKPASNKKGWRGISKNFIQVYSLNKWGVERPAWFYSWLKKNITKTLTTLLTSAQHSQKMMPIMPRSGSKTMIMFGL